jgi:hypothetical protein
MDYIALNQNPNPTGIIYNSGSRPVVGGIRYYKPKKTVTLGDPNDPSGAVVEVEVDPLADSKKAIEKITYDDLKDEEFEKDIEQKRKVLKQKAQDFGKRKNRSWQENLIAQEIENTKASSLEELIRSRSQKLEDLSDRTLDGDFTIEVEGQEICFSEIGVKEVELSSADRDWILSAQYYFLNDTKDGAKIGSARDYTTVEILEALWATAVHVGVEPKRFIVQLYNESRFNPNVVGAAGERGIGQFKKSTSDYKGYDWYQMSSGISGFAYQAKAAAEYVKSVGEVAYNGGGDQGSNYKSRITDKVIAIEQVSQDCDLSQIAFCES